MICIHPTVLIDEFRAKGDLSAPVNRALLTHGSEKLIVPAAAARLRSRNAKHFRGIEGLGIVGY